MVLPKWEEREIDREREKAIKLAEEIFEVIITKNFSKLTMGNKQQIKEALRH